MVSGSKGELACFKRGKVRFLVWDADTIHIIYRLGSKTDTYQTLFAWWQNNLYRWPRNSACVLPQRKLFGWRTRSRGSPSVRS